MSFKKRNLQEGQVLLIVVMIVAVVITIVTSIALKSTTDTKVTKLEEESQKTLSAAEAGIEAALKQNTTSGSFDITAITSLTNGTFSGNVTVSTATSKTQFSSPIIVKDQQYTLYLSNYPDLTGPYSGDLTFYISGTNCTSRDIPAVEFTLVYGAGSQAKFLAEPCTSGSHISGNGGTMLTTTAISGGTSIDGNNFTYKTNPITINSTNYPGGAKLLIVRMLYASSRIGVSSSATSLPAQGKYIVSDVKNNTGVQKTVTLFQSFPQIPSDFFVTAF